MKRILLLTFLLLSVSALCFSQKLVEVAKGYSCTSVNTTIFRNNSLVTYGMSNISAIMMPTAILCWANGN